MRRKIGAREKIYSQMGFRGSKSSENPGKEYVQLWVRNISLLLQKYFCHSGYPRFTAKQKVPLNLRIDNDRYVCR